MKKTVLFMLIITLVFSASHTTLAIDYPSVYLGFMNNLGEINENPDDMYWDAFLADFNNDTIPELVMLYGNTSNCTSYIYEYDNSKIDRAPYQFYSNGSSTSGTNTILVNNVYGKTQLLTTIWSREVSTENGQRTENITNVFELYEYGADSSQSLVRSFHVNYTNVMSEGVWVNKGTKIADSANPDVTETTQAEAMAVEAKLRTGLDIAISAEDFVYKETERKQGGEMDRFLSKFGHRLKVILNGTLMEFDQDPIIDNGRTLVPLRAIFEGLETTVGWEEATQTITSVKGDTTIIMQIGANTFTKNGIEIPLDVPPQIVGVRTLVPVRAISESLGAAVGWDEATLTVTITL